LRDWVTNNLGTKLASVGLALLFWLLVVANREMAASISVPVVFRNLPKDLELSSDFPEKVHLEIRGPSSRLTPSELNDTVAMVDLGDVTRPGQLTVPIRGEDTTLPGGVTLERAVPSMIQLTFDTRVKRQVPVRIVPSGIRGAVAVPDKVVVVGPSSKLDDLAFVETDAIEERELEAKGSVAVRLHVPEKHARLEGIGSVTVKLDRAER
jgi:YbbR domain-containing protein